MQQIVANISRMQPGWLGVDNTVVYPRWYPECPPRWGYPRAFSRCNPHAARHHEHQLPTLVRVRLHTLAFGVIHAQRHHRAVRAVRVSAEGQCFPDVVGERADDGNPG